MQRSKTRRENRGNGEIMSAKPTPGSAEDWWFRKGYADAMKAKNKRNKAMSKFKVGDEVCVIRENGINVVTISKITLVVDDEGEGLYETTYRLEASGSDLRDEPYYDYELFRKDEVEAELERRYKRAVDEFRTRTSKYKVGDNLFYMPRPTWRLNDFVVEPVKVLGVLAVEKGMRRYAVKSDKFTGSAIESDLFTKEAAREYVKGLAIEVKHGVDIEEAKWLTKIDEEFDE